MIYFDNAATTALKPPAVAQAVAHAIDSFGGVGRGVHGASLDAGCAVFRVRKQLADLLGAAGPSRVAFMANATDALNTAIRGVTRPGDKLVTTAASHNSVLRPLYREVDEHGCELTVVPHAPDGALDHDALDAALADDVRLAVVTHASNLTGDVYDIGSIASMCRDRGILLLVDAAQTAGLVEIDVEGDGIDMLAFTGHKSLYGPQGTGGLVVAEGVEVEPLEVGGSGTHSYDRKHPAQMPQRLEAGTLNAHGIAGLGAGLDYIEKTGVDALRQRTLLLAERFERGVRDIEGVRVYGGAGMGRTGIVALNVRDVDSAAVGDALNADFGICVRAGAHCAPLMHEALGTDAQGAVRFSFGSFNAEDEVDAGIEAVREIAREA